ncbi:MAG: PKD-like family lipoprotein [Candidatus Pseudobacter hemicellulosilyticus]|uniref:PKD-like family lipoprotein n=1 Tax=Candidatus Pseudobacter hemicellulosilyticus TaxID=3121375 RepID=A0AAJ5WQR8_9BACT|nr:MAG: PKD-like family lipoprotein [Pseudobacter sp.]
MKLSLYNGLLAVSLLVLLQACYKDEGNYDLIDYNRINTITTPTIPAVIMGDTLKLKPAITWKYPGRDTSDAAFEYEWRQVDSVVSRERDLAYAPNLPGYIMIYLYVKEKATGIVSQHAKQIQVISAYKAGWLMLANEGGRSVLHFIRRDTKRDANNNIYYEYKHYPDVFSTLYPGVQLGENPVRLNTRAFPDYTLDQVLVVQGNGTVFLSGDDFSKKIELRSEFPNQTFPQNARPVDYLDGGPANFALMDDGKLYAKRNAKTMGGLHDGFFMDVPYYFEGGGAHLTQIVESNYDQTSFVYLYDDLNKRFIGVYTTTGSNDYIGGKMYLQNSSTPPAGWVPLTGHPGYSMKYCSDHSNGVYFTNIMKNENTGQYLLQNYRLTMRLTYLDVAEQQQEVFAGNGIVTDNTIYYRLRNSSYLFFGEGSKLYFYDVNTKIVTLYHDFGTGKITKITSDANSGELGVLLDNGTFTICSLKNEVLGNADPGAVGILYQLPDAGNVIDLTWKWGSYFEFVFRRYPA